MTDEENDAIYAMTGIDTRLAGGPDNPASIEPPLSSAGEQAQAELLRCLARLRGSIELLEVIVRDRPNDDDAFNLLDQTFGEGLEAARAALQRFRERRECRGAS